MNRKRVILAALLGVLGLCLVYAYVATPRLEKAPPRAASQRTRPVAKATGELKAKTTPERINFDFLTAEPQPFPGAKRDIFRFGQKRPVRTEVSAPVVQAPAPPVETLPVMPEAVPLAVVQQSLGKFTFLGFLEKAGEKTVFLSSGGNLFLAKRGESFGADQEFLVADISDNLLRVRHAGRDDLLEIPLIEQQKLSASVSSPAKMPPVAAPPTQTRARTFTPKQRILRPAGSQENEEAVPGLAEENAPKEEQEAQPPAEGDVLEGETNGSNQ
jgi:hypothetical protein